MKPDNQRVDLESLKRQLRQEFDARTKELIAQEIDELYLIEELFLDSSASVDEENPESVVDEDEEEEPGSNDAVVPFINVKFRNNNNVFTKPTETNYFGDILLSSDGTTTVNVRGKIFDDQTGIDSYKIRIKRVD